MTYPLQEGVDQLRFLAPAMLDVAFFAQADEVVLAIPHQHRLGRGSQVDFVFCECWALSTSSRSARAVAERTLLLLLRIGLVLVALVGRIPVLHLHVVALGATALRSRQENHFGGTRGPTGLALVAFRLDRSVRARLVRLARTLLVGIRGRTVFLLGGALRLPAGSLHVVGIGTSSRRARTEVATLCRLDRLFPGIVSFRARGTLVLASQGVGRQPPLRCRSSWRRWRLLRADMSSRAMRDRSGPDGVGMTVFAKVSTEQSQRRRFGRFVSLSVTVGDRATRHRRWRHFGHTGSALHGSRSGCLCGSRSIFLRVLHLGRLLVLSVFTVGIP